MQNTSWGMINANDILFSIADFFPISPSNGFLEDGRPNSSNETIIFNRSDFNQSSVNFTTPDNNTYTELLPPYDLIPLIIVSTILGLLILATIIGNVFVIAAILLERNLQSVANYLILSLAVADLMVASLVMPLSAVYEVSKSWLLGPEVCDMWMTLDVLCCTASILHLVAIALDRYWAITNVDYIHQRNSTRIGVMILLVWVISLIVSIAPLFGWKDPGANKRMIQEKQCLYSQDISYQIFSTFAAFYGPLIVILIVYWKIFKAARSRIRRKVGNNARSAYRPPASSTAETTAFTTVSSSNTSPEKSSSTNGSTSQTSHMSDFSKMEMLPKKDKRKMESAEAKREKKAAKTLGIITGAFVVCWLPFFVVALLRPICKDSCDFNDYMWSVFLWLGYFNSLLNPIIYTIFSPDFRNAFKRILFGKPKRNRPKR